MVLLDFGAQFGGYAADITRTLFCGQPTDRFREVYQIVLDAQLTGIAAIRPGAAGRDVDAAARRVITSAGYGTSTVELSAAEAEVLAAFPGAVIIRPSLIFGPDDGYFNLMGALARMFPVLPLIGGTSRFQPVYVGDVADAFARAGEGGVRGGRVYELGGPEVLTHKELLQRILHETMRGNLLLPLPAPLAKLLAAPLALLPGKPLLTIDQVELLQADNVVSPEALREKRTLAAFRIEPTPMDAVLPTYLWRFRRNGQFDQQPA